MTLIYFFYLRCSTSSKLQQIIIAIKTISIIKHKFHTVSRTIFLRLEMIGVGVVWGVGWYSRLYFFVYIVSPQTPCPVCFSATPWLPLDPPQLLSNPAFLGAWSADQVSPLISVKTQHYRHANDFRRNLDISVLVKSNSFTHS